MHSENENRTLFEWIALRCQSGEAGAFEDLVRAMERPLLYYAASLTGNPDSGLDVLQEVWIKAWLYTITHGIAVDRIRRNSSRERAETVELENFQEAEELSFSEEDAAEIHQALSEIGLKHREVLVLHFLDDLSIVEIAKVVGCSEGTVKSRMHYAKRAMKGILSGGGYGTEK
jgi:RNA polymerase sigma-70 factor (ECF subfamily)